MTMLAPLMMLVVFGCRQAPVGTAERRSSEPGGAVVVDWSKLAYEIAFAEDSFRTFKGQRAFAMMHLAMHDAINGVIPRYRQFLFHGRDTLASPVVAAAVAARGVLVSQYPNVAARLDAELARALASTTDSAAASRGRSLGRLSANAVLAARADDGWDVGGSYVFDDRIGAYRTTPPWNGFVVQPGFRYARPFGLTEPGQFRPGPPPALESQAYATALNEVKAAGAKDGSSRTADQTGYAVWWMEYAEGSVIRLARQLAAEQRLPLADTARLFALLGLSLYDTYVAVWDSKFEFDHWRPYTAIREASRDDNSATDATGDWEPMRPTPPFPEYVSAHAAACAAAFEVIGRVLGDARTFTMETISAPAGMPTRRFASFSAAAMECADSRVRLGWHFRYSTDAGLVLGRAVADYIVTRHLAGNE